MVTLSLKTTSSFPKYRAKGHTEKFFAQGGPCCVSHLTHLLLTASTGREVSLTSSANLQAAT